MKKNLPLVLLALTFFTTDALAQPLVPFTNCPDANAAVLRGGTNADVNNPTSIYTVNTLTGVFTLLPGGPLRYPGLPNAPLHVNGIGVNRADGLLYGLALEGTLNTARFVRFGINYASNLISNIPPPTSFTGPLGFVNAAAGDVDRMNNYYFSAFTLNGFPIPNLDKFFLGKISNISNLTNAAIPEYYEIDISDANCTGYLASFVTDPDNSGLKDLAYSPFTTSFFSYLTYKPVGATLYNGQLVEFRRIPGSVPLKYKMFCTNVINTHTAETAGVLIDKFGTLFIMLTDGTAGRIGGTSPLNYTGIYIAINNNTGLPSPLRGDLGSCGGEDNILPVTLTSFDAAERDCRSIFSWTAENEVNFRHYELQQSFDNINFKSAGIIPVKNGFKNAYNFTLESPGKPASYRLKMVDLDGKLSYSSIENLNSSCGKVNAGFVINPNPVEKSMNINWYGISERTQVGIMVYNAQGNLVKNFTEAIGEGNSISNINVNTLPAGAYYIKVSDAKNKANFSGRFVKI